MSSQSAYVFGASGHGKVVAGALRASGYEVVGFFDDDPILYGDEFFGAPVLGGQEEFAVLPCPVAVVGIGNGRIREKIVKRFWAVEWIRVVHPAAWIDPSASVGLGTVIFAGAVIQPDVQIGVHCIINTGATIDHDCRILDYAHVCPGVNLAGGVTVGRGAWVGIGAQVVQGVSIGAGAVVGAGATVIRDVADNTTVVGTPAREIKGGKEELC